MITCFADRNGKKSLVSPSKTVHTPWIYYHGMLDDYFGYDINYTDFPLPLGKYPVNIFKSNAQATAFAWMDETEFPRMHGLIVFDYDKVSYEDAEKSFMEKSSNV